MTGRPPAIDTGQPPQKRRFRPRLRDARIRSKLGLILIIPLLAVIVLAAVRLVENGQRAISADQVRSLATVSAEASTVAHTLHGERMAAARLLANPDGGAGAYNASAAQTDTAVGAYEQARADLGTVPAVVADRLARIDDQLAGLGTIRQEILGDTEVTVGAAMLRYGVVLDDILAYQESVGQVTGDVGLAESVRAVASLSKAKLQMADAHAAAFVSLVDGEFSETDLTSLLAATTGQQEALLAFTQAASPPQRALVDSGLTGDAVVASERTVDDLVRSVGGEPLVSPEAADRALGAVVNLVVYTEEQLHADQVALATELRNEVLQQVLLESVAVVLALAIAITVAVLLARMLARSLGQLRRNAESVAERELPETVARLSDPRTLGENTPAQLAAQVREPIQMRSRDEVGQVARAFNAVHRSAVRVAAEQAALRTSVSAMFLNLARRSQSLVDRMISHLDDIERNEEDPKRLSRMFALDHLATRMRRNDENLLVLAGADSSPPRTDDAPVIDALRASQSEVEHYNRIEFGTVDTDVLVVAHAVNDVVRLAAELFDNATRFSPPDSAVVCEARRLGDQMIVQIEDRGVGMAQDQVGRLNAWLAAPPAVEVTTFRKMGLAVVARLAARHQIRVELRCDPNYGTIAYVALPRTILVLPRSRLRGAELPMPRSPLPVEQAPAAPPVPSRHLGQLPRRPAALAPQSEAAAPGPPGRRGYPDQRSVAANDRQPAAGYRPANAGNGAGAPAEANRVDLPVAGRPLYELTAQQSPPAPPPAATHHPTTPTHAAMPPNQETTIELPIFKEMEAVWFRSHGSLDLGRQAEAPRAGGYPAPADAPPPAPPPPAAPPATPTGAGQPAPEASGTEWQTAADSGWRAAAAAAAPTDGGSTPSGLPKRVPQAQLVPGSVESPATTGTQRRSPEEVRGLLSAYHRGVQRGRESGAR